MPAVHRREIIRTALALGAAWAIASPAAASRRRVRPRPEAFPQGVGSADPTSHGVLLWTRFPREDGRPRAPLTLQMAEDRDFRRIVAEAPAVATVDADWTCRVLVEGLKPGSEYWYRFIDESGGCSRHGRTFTAPAETDAAPVRFAFVSCQNINLGYASAYRRLISDDAARPANERIRFVLHLGDFIYEMIWSPEDRSTLQGRTVRDLGRLPTGRKAGEYQVPTTVEDYRHVYRAYLSDPDIQDARALWPFISIWDNHEFSNRCWQSQINYDGSSPAQSLKVAANQAWFEYVPARVSGATLGLERFMPPNVEDAPLDAFDDHGLSHEPGNLAAVDSLKIARALRWGANVELILTDNRSFRARPVADSPHAEPFAVRGFPWFAPQDAIDVLDAGRSYDEGRAPETIRFAGRDLPNTRRQEPPGSMLGAVQKRWLKHRLTESTARWKLWGNSVGMLHRRTDLQNLPETVDADWPSEGYGLYGTDDWCGYPAERRELLEFIRDNGLTNVVTLVGDRHSFFAGLLSPDLPPRGYAPVAAEFVVGSISTPTSFEAAEAALPLDRPLSPVYLHRDAGSDAVLPAMNLAMRHGVRACYELHRTGRLDRALAASNPEVAPHLTFADLGGHGFALARATQTDLEVEFVCTPRPNAPCPQSSGPDVVYRVSHRLQAWRPGERPAMRRTAQVGTGALILDLDLERADR